jgi:hypothetical protein
MSDDEHRDSFEETLRAMAQGLSESIQRVTRGDFDDLVRATGLDPEDARRWAQDAGEWMNEQAARFQGGTTAPVPARPARAEDTLRPHPLDTPTDEQGLALAALESGRWTIEPGTSMLVSHGDGPGPNNALGLVRELRVRDWIDADGAVTVAGRRALERWLS